MELDPTENNADRTESKHRKILDRDEFERQAREKARKQKEDEEDEERKRQGLRPIDRTRPKPSKVEDEDEPKQMIRAREKKLNLESKIGKSQVAQAIGTNKEPGYYCQHCDITMKDNTSWLDHINGRKHLINTGHSTKQYHSTLEQVIQRLEHHRKKRAAPKTEYDLQSKVLKAQQEEEQVKEAKKKRKQMIKVKKETELTNQFGEPDDEMSKMMGFSTFGTSKK